MTDDVSEELQQHVIDLIAATSPPNEPIFDGAQTIICMPVLYHIEPETFESIAIAMSRYGRDKVRFMSQEKTCVWEGRNLLAQRYLATDSEFLTFIDGDIFVPCGNANYFNARGRVSFPPSVAGLNVIDRLLSHPKDMLIVGGSYFDRQFGNQLQCSRGCGSAMEPGFNERYKRGELTGVSEVLWTATGCMRVHRSVFGLIQRNRDRFPETVPHKEGFRWGFFNPMRVGMGEDVSFCHRARACGVKIYQDYDLRVLHKGHIFR